MTPALHAASRNATGGVKLKDLLLGDELKASGSRVDLVRFFSLFAKAPGTFPIVTP